MQIQPYLFFDGSCEQALQFYQRAIGAKVEMMMRYKESPQPHTPGMVPPGYDDKVMHSSVRIGESVIMASDDCTGRTKASSGFSLSLSGGDPAEAKRRFDALAEGGQVTMPITKTFWSPAFGMLRDRFGVQWMVSAEA
jgi:PhnB protein